MAALADRVRSADGMTRSLVVGGGITGLTAALQLLDEAPDVDVTVLEAADGSAARSSPRRSRAPGRRRGRRVPGPGALGRRTCATSSGLTATLVTPAERTAPTSGPRRAAPVPRGRGARRARPTSTRWPRRGSSRRRGRRRGPADHALAPDDDIAVGALHSCRDSATRSYERLVDPLRRRHQRRRHRPAERAPPRPNWQPPRSATAISLAALRAAPPAQPGPVFYAPAEEDGRTDRATLASRTVQRIDIARHRPRHAGRRRSGDHNAGVRRGVAGERAAPRAANCSRHPVRIGRAGHARVPAASVGRRPRRQRLPRPEARGPPDDRVSVGVVEDGRIWRATRRSSERASAGRFGDERIDGSTMPLWSRARASTNCDSRARHGRARRGARQPVAAVVPAVRARHSIA